LINSTIRASIVGIGVGSTVGSDVGSPVVGCNVGRGVGNNVGDCVGCGVGGKLGDGVVVTPGHINSADGTPNRPNRIQPIVSPVLTTGNALQLFVYRIVLMFSTT
jgi:hypothetical protein